MVYSLLLYIRTSNLWAEVECSLNMLGISASNVLKMFLNTVVSIGVRVIIFSSQKLTNALY